MSLQTLDDLFKDELKDLYSAETQLDKALPKMAKKASSAALAQAFTDHLRQTQDHVARLEKIAEQLEFRVTGKKCAVMEGLVKEGGQVIDDDGEPAVIDAALISAAQRVEHYEIAGYGNARALADELGKPEVSKILQETLDEEAQADKNLTAIAQDEVFTTSNGNRPSHSSAAQ